jgi:hypothetical protein
MASSAGRPTVVAVLDGATATGNFDQPEGTTGSTAVRRRIFEAIRSQAPAIAAPRLDRAVAAGTITVAQREEFLARLEQADRRRSPVPEQTHDQRLLAASVFDAIRSEAPAIAEPLIEQALAEGSISPGEAEQITDRLRTRRVRIGRRRRPSRTWRAPAAAPAPA